MAGASAQRASPDQTHPDGRARLTAGDGRRRLVIFADGTGSAFSSQESNVWRLFEALDQSVVPGKTRQVARYRPGVGTAQFRLLALLDWSGPLTVDGIRPRF